MESRGMKAVQFSGRCKPLINGSKYRYKTETPIFLYTLLSLVLHLFADVSNMVTIEQSPLIFGLIAKNGNQDRCVKTEIKIVIINLHQEDQKQERKVEKEVTTVQKYQQNYVRKYSNVQF
jgi:hypothetical protein